MKKILLVVALLAAVTNVASAQVFSNGVALPIPDSPAPAVTSSIVVAGGPVVTDVNVCINITHTWDSDLDIVLRSPSGGVLNLVSDGDGSGDNFVDTVFDDAATTSITAGVPPYTGSFRPQAGAVTTPAVGMPVATLANLAAYNGAASNGSWDLVIGDDVGADTGTLTYWSLAFNGAVDPSCVVAPPPPPAVDQDLGNLAAGVTMSNNFALAAGQVRWFQFTTVAIANPNYLIADTIGSTTTSAGFGPNDTEIGIYNSSGNLVVTSDDINFVGANDPNNVLLSRVRFGTPPGILVPPVGPSEPPIVGALPAGTYYAAVGGFNTTYNATNFGVSSTSTVTGSVKVNLTTNVPEPATLAMLAFGGLALIRRRK